MINRLVYILFLCILMTSCSSRINSKFYFNEASMAKPQIQEFQGNIKIINSHTNVKLGEAGHITIQGKPRVRYTIKTSYKMDNRTISVTQWRVGGSDGRVTFNWVVDPKTAPGTYTAEITGGGDRIVVNHTVIP